MGDYAKKFTSDKTVELRHLYINPSDEELREYPNGFFFHMAMSRTGHNYIRENIQSWTAEQPRKYYNFENVRPDKFIEKFKDINLDDYQDSIYVLQSRDLLNWFGSWMKFVMIRHLKKALERGIGWDDLIEINLDTWCALNKEMYGETKFIDRKFVSVIYDEFFKSEEYRRKICTQVGGKYNEDKLLEITKDGKGSTWDGFSYDGRATEMGVLERYKHLSPQYEKTLKKALKEHPEALDIYKKYYVLTDDQKEYINNF